MRAQHAVDSLEHITDALFRAFDNHHQLRFIGRSAHQAPGAIFNGNAHLRALAGPATFVPSALAVSKCMTASTTAYFFSSSQCGAIVGEPQAFGMPCADPPYSFPDCGRACHRLPARRSCHRRNRGSKEARISQPRHGAKLIDATLDIRMSGFPVIHLHAVRLQHGSVRTIRVHVHHVALRCNVDMSRASITPTLSAKISSPSLSTTPNDHRHHRSRARHRRATIPTPKT